MKTLITLTFSVVLFTFTACKKDPGFTNPVCKEQPPKDELCDAYFQRWFYNAEKNKCEQIGYSGCSMVGFETREDCEECECKFTNRIPFRD